MSDQHGIIEKRHSFYTREAPRIIISNNTWKSDVNILKSKRNVQEKRSEEYYKRYELDEIPVKDDCSFNDHSFSEGHDSGTGDNKDSITNSDLDKLEMKIMIKMSQELQTDVSSVSSLDSNIKLFKTTVQQIFDNFHEHMFDFEEYKKKFDEIITRNRGDSVNELEEFISNMLHHIRSSQSSVQYSKNTDRFCKSETIGSIDDEEINNEIPSFTKSFTINNTLKDSPKVNSTAKKEDRLNIYLVRGSPRLGMKMANRSLLSDINVREHCVNDIGNLASADNLKKLTAKKIELERYVDQQEHNVLDSRLDRDIPVKNSCAKKNIHLNEDFDEQVIEENKFFIFKICSYICKKLRKN